MPLPDHVELLRADHLDGREATDWYCACCGVEHRGGGYAAWLRRRGDAAELAVVVCASCLSEIRNEGGDDGPGGDEPTE